MLYSVRNCCSRKLSLSLFLFVERWFQFVKLAAVHNISRGLSVGGPCPTACNSSPAEERERERGSEKLVSSLLCAVVFVFPSPPFHSLSPTTRLTLFSFFGTKLGHRAGIISPSPLNSPLPSLPLSVLPSSLPLVMSVIAKCAQLFSSSNSEPALMCVGGIWGHLNWDSI